MCKQFGQMLQIVLVLVGVVVCVGAGVTRAQDQAQEAPQGFHRLFNGENLDGWWGLSTEDPRSVFAVSPEKLAARKAESQADIHEHWRVEDGQLVNDGHGLFLTTDQNYGDFELLLEYKTVAGADSGVYLRGCPQVQIWDTTKAGGKWDLGADKGSGGLWNNSPGAPGKDPLVLADKPFGQWNQLRIVMVGSRVSVWLNDQLVVDHAILENYFDRSMPVPATGPIQLQTHGGEIRWKNIFLREIPADEANEILRSHDNDGYASIFNGQDFTGWAGPIDNYAIVDGAIQCKPHHGGTIYFDKDLRDFSVRFEFRLPPGGNNGLAIRYPGTGDTAYVGMCELQVLDNTDPRYANLDPRQYHGSVYGQVAAKRGYLRPVGQWNFQQVTVKGSQITVELNGTTILDADISKVKDFMYEPEKFKGRHRTHGYFGFAGHNDPVAFRKIAIKELE